MGVNLFFVLSGFLITRILLSGRDNNVHKSIFPPIKQFYIRRTLRIFPIYYLTILFLFIINFQGVRGFIGWLLTYTFNIKFSLPGVWESNQLGFYVHLWSLSVEEQFYLFFPLLIFLIPKKGIKPFFFIMVILGVLSCLVLYLIKAPSQSSQYVLTPCCFDAFGVGALMAYYFLYEQDKLKKALGRNGLFLLVALLFVADIVYSRLFIKGYGECRTVLERFIFSVLGFWIVGKAVVNSWQGPFRRFLENK